MTPVRVMFSTFRTTSPIGQFLRGYSMSTLRPTMRSMICSVVKSFVSRVSMMLPSRSTVAVSQSRKISSSLCDM
ncbi:MAG: hypothetical protein BWY81_01289 [Firmicutes bacterium ADurb.Bin467]|nr:MAG: hypothetical protein BWY81_01289 [Firmicutes bacterium ADurb.Bin467]